MITEAKHSIILVQCKHILKFFSDSFKCLCDLTWKIRLWTLYLHLYQNTIPFILPPSCFIQGRTHLIRGSKPLLYSFSSTPLFSWILRFSILLSTLANIFPSHQVFSWHGALKLVSPFCVQSSWLKPSTLLREESFKPWIWFLVAINLWSFSEESHKLMLFLGRPPGLIPDHFPGLSVLDVIILTPQTL